MVLLGMPIVLHAQYTYLTTNDRVTITGYTGSGGAVTLPNTIEGLPVTRIGDLAFLHCNSLTSVTIGNRVTSIGKQAFRNCTSLTSVTIPNGVISIEDDVFAYCPLLAGITIPSSVTSIGDWVFNSCTALEGVRFKGNAPIIGLNAFSADDHATVYYLAGKTGWDTTFAGRPTALWNPQIQSRESSFGVRTNRFGFTIIGANGLDIVVEGSADLVRPIWMPLQTNTLNGNPFYFIDPQFYADTAGANAPRRFYRARIADDVTVNQLPENPDPEHLAWIHPGTFTMGSPASEPDHDQNESPQTQVTISSGFWMSRYEVTQGEYLTATGNNPSTFTGDTNRPVEMVSWEDATNYCAKLTARERTAGRLPSGYEYRLPTEAEWEYACRGGTTTATAYGDSLSSTQANFDGAQPYGGAAKGTNVTCTTPAGFYAPNAWGLYDMTGNVSEWCLDWYFGMLPGGTVIDPTGPNTAVYRVLRGGNWKTGGQWCRSAARLGSPPMDTHFAFIGFRPVLARDLQNNVIKPVMLIQPESQKIKVGESVVFGFIASGTPLFYQWQFNSTNIIGATDASYRIASVQMANAGNYSVVVSNSAGSVMSQSAVLTVTTPLNPDPSHLVWINSGNFMMGTPGSQVIEGPQTQVTLSRGFWMSKYETTQEEYLALIEKKSLVFYRGLEAPSGASQLD